MLTSVDVLDFADGSSLVLEAGGTAGARGVGSHCIYKGEKTDGYLAMLRLDGCNSVGS